jgi:hypothetical protein
VLARRGFAPASRRKQQRAIRPLRSTPGCPVALKPESASGPGASAEPANLKGAAR